MFLKAGDNDLANDKRPLQGNSGDAIGLSMSCQPFQSSVDYIDILSSGLSSFYCLLNLGLISTLISIYILITEK